MSYTGPVVPNHLAPGLTPAGKAARDWYLDQLIKQHQEEIARLQHLKEDNDCAAPI